MDGGKTTGRKKKSNGSGVLPFTGAEIGKMSEVGVGAAVLGAGLQLAARQRKRVDGGTLGPRGAHSTDNPAAPSAPDATEPPETDD